jgi:spore coat polysaccharide biosynthesis protein SpsF (cytidylyltransferase family)
MKTGIIICSRVDSSRIKSKATRPINGIPVIERLVKRISQSGIPVYVAVPKGQESNYSFLSNNQGVEIFTGSKDDPLARMYHCAKEHKLDNIIRICHDKIFVDPYLINAALDVFLERRADYLYSPHFTAGSGFEIISYPSLQLAHKRYKNVEHISYAIRCVTENIISYYVPLIYRSDHRLLLDYMDDLVLIKELLLALGDDCTLKEVVEYLDMNPELSRVNKLPTLTVYTCAYNAEKYINQCMGSVSAQKNFRDIQYILINDCSEDKTSELMEKFSKIYPNVEVHNNNTNIGLSSSSNLALKKAKGEYIIRLDADDYFPKKDILNSMLFMIRNSEYDIVYPDNYFGSMSKVQKGFECHHPGGAIASTRALNYLKFTDRLRGYEGLDLYLRAKEQLKIGYIETPAFFYRQHKESLSKNNLKERERVKNEIFKKYSKSVFA